MAVKDFMTKRVVYVSPETTVAAAADIMRDKGLRRLPVIEHDKLVGLITEVQWQRLHHQKQQACQFMK